MLYSFCNITQVKLRACLLPEGVEWEGARMR